MAGKIQKQDVKTEAELLGAGATKADLINDTQIYVTATGINKTLDDAITDGDIGGGSIPPSSVTNAELAIMANATLKGRYLGAGAGNPLDLTAAEATTVINNFVGDSGSGGTKGLVPAPAAGDAAANKFLKANGSWVTPGGVGFTSFTIDIFISSGTWTKPANCIWVEVWVVGGGGGSGGVITSGAANGAFSGGDGGGGMAHRVYDAAGLAASHTVTVGAGGSGGSAAPTNGGNGGTSSFNPPATVSASGGTGSAAVNNNASLTGVSGLGGIFGTGAGGTVNISGQRGESGWHIPNEIVLNTIYGMPGSGGSSGGGFGQGGHRNDATQPVVSNGGGLYGGGASGTSVTGPGASSAGSAGAAGVVIIKNYIG